MRTRYALALILLTSWPAWSTKMPYRAALAQGTVKSYDSLSDILNAHAVVNSCLQDESIEDSYKEVSCSIYERGCRSFSGRAKYAIEKRGREMIIHMPMVYKYSGDETKRTQVLKNLEDGRLCTIDFYARYNITMDLSFTEATNFNYDIRLYDDSPATNYISWALIKDNSRVMPKREICNTVIHELSHHLGLPDTYAGASCRLTRPSSNMMTNVYWDTDRLHLDNDQIEQIVGYVCKDAACPGVTP